LCTHSICPRPVDSCSPQLGVSPRGWNTYDNTQAAGNESYVLEAARYMRDNLLPFGYDTRRN
jgi:hypothetical protein